MLYWLAVWLMMAFAFTAAWAFIVKGCEALDDKHPDHGSHEPSPVPED